MDDIGLHPAFSEPARQPEAVTPGLIGNDNALKRPTRFCGLVPPTLQKPEQRVPIRLKFLQRLAVNPWHDPGHEPAWLAHLDHHNQGAILLEGSEGSAQVVRLWYGGTSSVLSSDDRASPLAAPHSIYTPVGGSWLNMAESIERVLKRRALDGQHPHSPAEIGSWFEQTARAWNEQPTPFVWNGKRRQRRRSCSVLTHRLGGSGACTHP